jgi:hypothetical protein
MKKLMTVIGAVGLAFTATAGVDDALLSFSTVGPDKYADGSDVLPGECYALVWSADGQFEGIKADGTTIDPADKVVLVAPVAKQGANGTCCPAILYQVDKAFADAHANGQYAVYILDTRVKAADGTVAVGGVDENGALKVVNGYDAVSAGTTATSAAESIKTVATTAVGGASVATLAEVDAPVITAIKPNGTKITISTSGLSPVVNYKVVTGTALDKVSTEINATADEKGDFTFEKPENSAFFKVIGVRKIEDK